jgi:type IV pilus secretin PilQ/predicted competence protein
MNARARIGARVGMRLIAAAALAWIATGGAAATVLTDAQLTRTPEGAVLLRLTGDGGFEPRHFVLDGPYRVVLDLVGTEDPVGVTVPADGGFVKAVRYAPRPSRDGKPVVRYVLETSGEPKYTIETAAGELRLLVMPAAAKASDPAPLGAKTPVAAATATASAVAKAESAAPKTEPVPVPKPVPATPAKTETPAVPKAPAAAPAKAETAAAPLSAAVTAPKAEPVVTPVAQPVAAPKTEPAAVKPAVAPPKAPAGATTVAAAATTPVAPAPALTAEVTPAPAKPKPAVAAPKSAPPAVKPGPELLAAEESVPRMNLDVQGADILTVLRSISDYAGVNIVADANVSGLVTIRALDLPWPDMLAAVCEALALEAIDNGTVVRVATQKTAREEELARETSARKQEEYMPLFTRIVAVDYANAGELQETLAKMVSDRGHVEVDKRTNALVVTDIEPRVAQIEAMINRLDSETVQVEIMAKIVDVDATESRQLGISWGASNLHSPSVNATGQVALEPGELVDPAADMRVAVIRSFGEIEARLQALEKSNKAEIVSTPRITTVDNRMASILVGKEVPLITLYYAGNAITELKKVGIALEVTPHVNADNEITMDLHPEVSDLASQSTAAGSVVFTMTEADTRVLVQDGQTAVIAGLIRGSETTYESGIPYLKDVPLLGNLFKTSDKRIEKRELLIFITPRIVRPGGV